MRRTLLVISGLFFACAISMTAPRLAAVELWGCSEHFACPNEQYDCCCAKGVRCDLDPYQCERWCNGEFY